MSDQIQLPSEPVVAPVGQVNMVPTIQDGKIHLYFEQPMRVVIFEPQNMLDICEKLAELAYEARGDMKPAGGALKHDIVEKHRKASVNKIALMLNTTREDKSRSHRELAETIVDAIFQRIF